MSISFDPIACTLALLAISIAWYEIRRSYRVVLRIVEAKCGGGRSLYENNGQTFYSFELLIRNIGRPLHDVQLVLEFREPSSATWMTCPLRHFPADNLAGDLRHEGEFAHGMIGRFGFKSYQLDFHGRQFLSLLKNPAKQEAVIRIYSQGYFSKEFPIGTGIDLIKQRCNEFGWRINRLFDTKVSPPNSTKLYHKSGNVVPRLQPICFQLDTFLRGLKSIPMPPEPPRSQWPSKRQPPHQPL